MDAVRDLENAIATDLEIPLAEDKTQYKTRKKILDPKYELIL